MAQDGAVFMFHYSYDDDDVVCWVGMTYSMVLIHFHTGMALTFSYYFTTLKISGSSHISPNLADALSPLHAYDRQRVRESK